MPDPLAFKKDPEGDRWAGEDADEDDIKESWEEEEPTPVFLYMLSFRQNLYMITGNYLCIFISAAKFQVFIIKCFFGIGSYTFHT